ncbi:hypothetical protein [Amycolatopsis taiwanensis]|nr:hypothetical protein [Amycolatopsis taiwanensis]
MDKDTGEITITTPTDHHYTSKPEPLHEPRENPLPDADESPPF